MALHLTPALLEAVYELLRVTPPFKRWKLPHADEVEFQIIRNDTHGADYHRKPDGTHVIRVNSEWTGSLPPLERRIGHEMIHMYIEISCPSEKAHHGWRFKRLAAQVCRHHTIDLKTF